MPRRSPLHERDAGALHRDVGAGAHRDADVGLREGRRVVDAVAGHGDAFARLPAGASRPPPSAPAAHPLRRDRCRRTARPPRRSSRLSPVSMTTPKPFVVQRPDRFARRRLDRIGDADEPGGPAVDGDEHDGLAVAAQLLGARRAARPGRRRAPRGAAGCRSRPCGRRPCRLTPLPVTDSKSVTSPSATPLLARAARRSPPRADAR